MARPDKQEPWLLEAVEAMARLGLSLVEAVGNLGLDITTQECDTISRRKSFNKLVWETRHRYFTELANSPSFNQDVLIGSLLTQAKKLDEMGSYDKAAEVLLKLAKIKGWVGPENQVSVFGELSQSDIDGIRKKLEGDVAKPRPN